MAGYAGFYQHSMPAALKRVLFCFQPLRGGTLVAKKRPPPHFFLVVTGVEVACQKEFLRRTNMLLSLL
jgi:hypothetical protein